MANGDPAIDLIAQRLMSGQSGIPTFNELSATQNFKRQQRGIPADDLSGKFFDPFNPLENFDFVSFLRGQGKTGIDPGDQTLHADSRFKSPTHPTRFGVDMLPGGVQMREPTETEKTFFRDRPEVAGMAAEDGAVILNPFSTLGEDQKRQVSINEAARVVMARDQLNPTFSLTDEQKTGFSNYGTPQNIRETIAARLLSADPSAMAPTQDQLSFVDLLKQKMPMQITDRITGQAADLSNQAILNKILQSMTLER